MKRGAKLEDIDAAIARVESKMFRTVNALNKLKQRRKRFLTCHCAAEPEPHLPHRAQPKYAPVVKEIIAGASKPIASDDPLDIPKEFRRDIAVEVKAANERIAATAAEIKAEIEAKKAIKAKASAAKSKAKAKGELRKMPLTGKAALAMIRSEG